MDAHPLHSEPVHEAAFRHTESVDAGKLVLQLGGELDMFISPSLATRFHELAEDGTRDVVVDLSEVRFIDTTALEVFVSAQKELQAHDHALAVVAEHPYARRTFELTGLDDLLRVSGSRDEAVARLAD